MITDTILETYTDEQIQAGDALCWVIDGQVVYDANVSLEHGDIFLSANSAEDISSAYPEHDGLTIQLLKDGEPLEVVQTSEYFGSILLSEPTIINLSHHKNGRYVFGTNATYSNYEFQITDRQVGPGWYPGKEPEAGQIAKCDGRCHCGWSPDAQK